MKAKKFDCVELQHQGALRIYEVTKNMTLSEEVAYWEGKDKEFRRQRACRTARRGESPRIGRVSDFRLPTEGCRDG